MEKKDRERFGLAMNKIRVSLPGPNYDEKERVLRTEVFWEELKSYDISNVEGALDSARRELKFFPTPSDIIDRLNPVDPRTLPDYWPERKGIENKEKPLSRDEAKVFLQKIYDYVSKNSDELRADEVRDRKERFEKRREELKRQAKLLKEII